MADRKMPNWHSVLDKNKEVLYTGSPFETSLWLEGITDFEAANIHWVRIAKTGEVQSIKDYMDGAKPKQHNVDDAGLPHVTMEQITNLRAVLENDVSLYEEFFTLVKCGLEEYQDSTSSVDQISEKVTTCLLLVVKGAL
ncbi:hypothetical protein SEA_RIMA_78 [Streptomyces phage Rima]|uniref:Uncharacterized protein n=3 Tax=Rimavirus rima TaxID=2560784 RepID=A0A1I9SDV3_9CAUD|nr:hypothetical protein FDH06_gp78 [Streptomyces phage Rima]AOZ65030.1 hypothetical protein SEA_RIMA_78 [Streptomyces phage Rima]QAY16289.1 hypothetical protein SEA_ICEWARRIOR_77 [Streptomyces phage IceWarrior]QAY16377.1 hypothetical protein SEA_NAMO_79 [Streptomyces phage Namo]